MADELDQKIERLQRALADLALRLPLDPDRAYSDKEVCALLGNISRSTLWRIRRAGLLDTVELYPGGAARTTGRQIAEYLRGRERSADVLHFTATGRKRGAA